MKAKIEHLQELIEHGIGFFVSELHCQFFLTPDEVPEFMKGEDTFFAQKHGLSTRAWLAWKEAINTRQCQGITKKGTRCKQTVWVTDNPGEFVDGDQYCGKHKGKDNIAGGNIKIKRKQYI